MSASAPVKAPRVVRVFLWLQVVGLVLLGASTLVSSPLGLLLTIISGGLCLGVALALWLVFAWRFEGGEI